MGGNGGIGYAQIKISVSPGLASSFKSACADAGVSMASLLSKFMADYCCLAESKRKPPPRYSTRRQRRAAVDGLAKQLSLIREHEERYRDSIPENLHGSVRFENAGQSVELMDEAIEILSSVY